MPGGILLVEIDDDFAVTQTGPVTKVAEGALSLEGLDDGAHWALS